MANCHFSLLFSLLWHFFLFCLHHCRGCLERVQLLKALLVFTLRTCDFFLNPSFLSQAFEYNTICFFNKKINTCLLSQIIYYLFQFFSIHFSFSTNLIRILFNRWDFPIPCKSLFSLWCVF